MNDAPKPELAAPAADPSPTPQVGSIQTFESDELNRIGDKEYAELDEKTKHSLVRARHSGLLRASEQVIYAQLLAILGTPRPAPEGSPPGTPSPGPYTLADLVVVVMGRDDQVVPDEMRTNMVAQNLEVAVFCADRADFAKGMRQWSRKRAPGDDSPVTFPYVPLARALECAPPPGTTYFSVFDMNRNMTVVVAFDPATAGPQPPAAPALPPATP